MKKSHFAILFIAFLAGLFAIFFVLNHESALITHPKGIMARKELELIITITLLILIIIVPTIISLLVTAWKYQSRNGDENYNPNQKHSAFAEALLWLVPAFVVVVMQVITWYATHALDPYQPMTSEIKPLKIQVVALDWKWLFIYPEQEIATLNFVQFPAQTPIHFELSGDGSPMNSFWIPQLSGQIYAMTGMITPLHIMADETGEYSGKAAEINGEGYSKMTFVAKSSTPSDFEAWVSSVKQSTEKLNDFNYNQLVQRSEDRRTVMYSDVEKNLFNKIVQKYLPPTKKT